MPGLTRHLHYYIDMALPFFYINSFNGEEFITLDEDTSRHIVQVLRMDAGEQLNLTDGKGTIWASEISEPHKKNCQVKVISSSYKDPALRNVTIAISLLKNTNRFEWFLEKATEIGISEIIPLICERTEKEKFRWDRMNTICISAMLQSQQCWLPVLHEPIQFGDLVMRQFDTTERFIAHCEEGDKKPLPHIQITKSSNHLIVIGPEGDFTKEEIDLALQNNFSPVSLGENRLRTETAGVVAATLLMYR
ncbi:MAG TPA: RsmE family RNA methyltransferase [Chitinophagaceae bacterium]|nr:RsmE family RNA methyltransferase [Chitinophagaceae bacterium]